ncbi:MAG: Zn-ribbon domain-containing OB-fold protein [Thermodesulfobacteriota bacterium]|jgi:uncharacterized OB-fold protein
MSAELEPVVHSKTRLWKYRHYAGPVRSKFLAELRDNKRIMGTKCPVCNRVYLPARPTCFVCFGQLYEWVEVSNKGTLVTYTVVHQKEPTYPLDTPFVYGIVRLDGADTGLAHIISEVDPEHLRIGMRLEAVFKEERQGSILDIKYFRPLY